MITTFLPFLKRQVSNSVVMAPHEDLVMKSVKEDPSKWFLDHSEGARVLRAANREKGVALSVGEVKERDLDGFVAGPPSSTRVTCGRVSMGETFSRAFSDWAVSEYNRRLSEELGRVRAQTETAILDAFK
jgi:hypothetical protein